ncbi:DUF6262 family protein [Acidaminococcus sp. HCP3S3_H5]|uniref:DUF6262 family protein n=1 Tax=Acidaminococcus sp. HCP3S3_H5 TaxID=3438733 RepID=UPI003F90AC67
MDKTREIIKLAKQKTEDKVVFVTSVIHDMQTHHKKISFYSVAKETGVSKSFLYSNERLKNIIVRLRNDQKNAILDAPDSETLMAALRKENKRLQAEIKVLQKDKLWKEKYEDAVRENSLLKKRIEILAGKLYE